MIGDKEKTFTGKGTDLGALQSHIEDYLKKDGFTVQTSASGEKGSVVQAKKGGFLRGIVDADRALTITITGQPAEFTVRVGVGKWVQNLGVAAVETLLISGLFLVVDVAESAWNIEIEDKLVKDFTTFIG
jgi:hypothetical protein